MNTGSLNLCPCELWPWIDTCETPCFIVDEEKLIENLRLLDDVQAKTGAKILLALKGFAMFRTFPLLRKTLHGVCASSPDEAKLGRTCFGREVHGFAAAYSETDMIELAKYVDHIIFNSFSQLKRFGPIIQNCGHSIEMGLRINPECSQGAVPIYDPCAPHSRLGIRLRDFEPQMLDNISGLHFHALCEQNADALANVLESVEAKFGSWMRRMKWINFGGGHHITRADYDIATLCNCIQRIQQRYDVEVYLEPGEAVALNVGWLVATVLDIVMADKPIAILDTSATAHMPDVLEAPYRPDVVGAEMPNAKAWTYQLAGKSCLAGDVIGEYSFDDPLKPGDKLVFQDMAHYSMVKTTTFNGLRLPTIALLTASPRAFEIVRKFDYEDFKNRLS